MSQSADGFAASCASVTGAKPSMFPCTLRPVRPAAAAAAAATTADGDGGSLLASALRTLSGIAPFATLPIAVAVLAVSAPAPGIAPFAWSRNAARLTYVCVPKLPGDAGG